MENLRGWNTYNGDQTLIYDNKYYVTTIYTDIHNKGRMCSPGFCSKTNDNGSYIPTIVYYCVHVQLFL